MKGIIVLITLALATSSNTFLRNLEAVTVSAATGSGCFTAIPTTITLTGKIAATAQNVAATLKLKSGENIITLNCASTQIATTDTSYPCTYTAPQAAPKFGEYTIDSVTETTTTGTTFTLSDTVKGLKYNYVEAYTVKATQSKASQEVDSKSDDKKTFTVELDDTPSAVNFFSDSAATKKISCSVANKVATCTPTSTEMEDGKSYDIYSKAGCAESATKTGVNVKYSGSSFVAFSKYAMIVAALFLF